MKNVINWIVGVVVAILAIGMFLGYQATRNTNAGLDNISQGITAMDQRQGTAQADTNARLHNLETAPTPDLSGVQQQIQQTGDDLRTELGNTVNPVATAIIDTNSRIDDLIKQNIGDMWFKPASGHSFKSGDTITSTVFLPGAYSGSEQLTRWEMPDGSYLTGQTVSFPAPTVAMTKTFGIQVTAKIRGQTNTEEFEFEVTPAPATQNPNTGMPGDPKATQTQNGVTVLNTGVQTSTLINSNEPITLTKSYTIAGNVFSINGLQSSIDRSHVELAEVAPYGTKDQNGKFLNRFGAGTQMVLGGPGSLLIDLPACAIDDADLATMRDDDILKIWAKRVKAANGSIDCYNEMNHFVVQTDNASKAMAPEGGFAFNSFGGGTVYMNTRNLGPVQLRMEPAKGRAWFLIVRGNYRDDKPDTDANTRMHYIEVVGGHVEYARYPFGAFVNDTSVLQDKAKLAHTGGTNCGDAGCSELYIMAVDINTGAYSVAMRKSSDPVGQYTFVQSNWTKDGK